MDKITTTLEFTAYANPSFIAIVSIASFVVISFFFYIFIHFGIPGNGKKTDFYGAIGFGFVGSMIVLAIVSAEGQPKASTHEIEKLSSTIEQEMGAVPDFDLLTKAVNQAIDGSPQAFPMVIDDNEVNGIIFYNDPVSSYHDSTVDVVINLN